MAELVWRTPIARPRRASGTIRWMSVVFTTSRSRSPATATPIASIATRMSPAIASQTSPIPPTSPPIRSGTLSLLARSAPPAMPAITPPTPVAALRYPVPASPAWSTSSAMTTVSTPIPPPTRLVAESRTNGPASGPAS